MLFEIFLRIIFFINNCDFVAKLKDSVFKSSGILVIYSVFVVNDSLFVVNDGLFVVENVVRHPDDLEVLCQNHLDNNIGSGDEDCPIEEVADVVPVEPHPAAPSEDMLEGLADRPQPAARVPAGSEPHGGDGLEAPGHVIRAAAKKE